RVARGRSGGEGRCGSSMARLPPRGATRCRQSRPAFQMRSRSRMNEDAKFDSEATGPMSRKGFEQLGDGEVAYIKQLNLDLAQKLFPALRGKLEGIDLYAV